MELADERKYLKQLLGKLERRVSLYRALLADLEADETVGQLLARKPDKERLQGNAKVPLPMRERRRKAGITVQALATRLGLSGPYVSQVESGSQKAKPVVVENWERVLGEMIAERQNPPIREHPELEQPLEHAPRQKPGQQFEERKGVRA